MSRTRLQVNKLAISLCLVVVTAAGLYGQTPAPKPPKVPPTRVEGASRPSPKEFPSPAIAGRSISEKALAVDANVNINIPCISQAKVIVNGWERNEIRVFIKNGGKFAFRVHEKDAVSGKPVWVLITPLIADRSRPMSDCLSGDSIEIDVPMNASLSIKGHETETRIDSIKKVSLKNLGGSVSLRNISGGIMAATFEGDVAVENSGGQISLETSTGNINAFEVGPGQIGDTFKATTNNGAISLQKVEHRQIEAKSVSGSVIFNGKFLSGGLYNFNTSKGSIKLAIPGDSSCRIIASFGYGNFNSAFPLKILTENVFEGGKSIVANIGAGDATVKVTTSSGSIGIKKQ
jgi:hypothetical protein